MQANREPLIDVNLSHRIEHGAIPQPGCFSYSFIVTSYLVMAFRAHSLHRPAYRYKSRVPP